MHSPEGKQPLSSEEFMKLLDESSLGSPQVKAVIAIGEKLIVDSLLRDIFPTGKPPKPEGKGNPPKAK